MNTNLLYCLSELAGPGTHRPVGHVSYQSRSRDDGGRSSPNSRGDQVLEAVVSYLPGYAGERKCGGGGGGEGGGPAAAAAAQDGSRDEKLARATCKKWVPGWMEGTVREMSAT